MRKNIELGITEIKKMVNSLSDLANNPTSKSPFNPFDALLRK
jgi:hypothetical protein